MDKYFDYKRTVLVADDEEINRQLLAEILKDSYEIIFAENGTEAIGTLQAYKEKISLVLLDLLMPETDGYKVLELLKEDAELHRIPVIVLTSEKDAEVKSLQMGAVDFIKKPYDMPEVIQARVRRSIELAEDSKLIQSTERDAETGLYTKDFFFEYANQLHTRQPEKLMDAIVIEFTNFHLINELHGRETGASVIRVISQDIIQIAEEAEGIAGRFSQNGFYLYMAQNWNYEKPLERIVYHLSSILQETEIQIRMGLCQGMYLSDSLEHSFERAHHACTTLNNLYGTAVATYNNEMHEQELREAKLLSGFPAAIEQEQFVVYYQPKFNIKGEKPVLSSVEALVKWQHPEFGLLQPGSFIPQFENNGLIQKLDNYVWKKSAEQVKKWKVLAGKTIPASVNVSRIDLSDPEIVKKFTELTESNDLKKEELLLEITESAYIQDSEQMIQAVKDLRAAGFKIEMDDFGSGYSSLNMLSAMPIDALKLDIAFVRNIEKDKVAFYMVKVVMEIAKTFGIPVIAEGVETQGQYELLKKAGCDVIQGYYFSKPVLPHEIIDILEKEFK